MERAQEFKIQINRAPVLTLWVAVVARKAMKELTAAFDPEELAQRGFSLYEQFRPQIPEAVVGWGAKGELNLGAIRKLAALPK